jgi:hypothetical protein
MNQNQKPNWVLIAILAILVFFVVKSLKEDSNPGPGPQPIPNNVSSVTEKATLKYADLLSEDMKSLASEVGAGTLKTSKAVQDRARELTAKSREEAFMPVSQLDNKFIPTEISNDNKASVSEYLLEKSKGHKKAGN